MSILDVCMVTSCVVTDCKCSNLWWLMCLGVATRIGLSTGQGHPTGETCWWFPPFSRIMLMFWNDLVMDDILLNPWWRMKQRWNVWLNSWRMLKHLWNVDRILDECWNDDKNVNVLKWLVWGGYIIALWWILNWLWDVNWVVMKLGYWRMSYWLWNVDCDCWLASANGI
jgi:hypothetical protein